MRKAISNLLFTPESMLSYEPGLSKNSEHGKRQGSEVNSCNLTSVFNVHLKKGIPSTSIIRLLLREHILAKLGLSGMRGN